MVVTKSLNAADLRLYLEASGWTNERSDQRRSIWLHETGARIFVPGGPGPDVESLLSIGVTELSKVEKRSEDEIILDLAWLDYDRLRVRKATADTAVSITDAIELHEAVGAMILSGARAQEDPRPSYAGRQPAKVHEYMEKVRILPSVPGSFVVRALLPLNRPDLPQQPLPLFGPSAAEIHSVSWKIMHASEIAIQTAAEVALGANLDEWNRVVTEGVSANLCDALSRLPGDSAEDAKDIDISIGWTWAEPFDTADKLHINTGLAPILAQGCDFLRDVPEEYDIRLRGLVTKLHREAANGAGDVTVRGHIDNYDSGARSLRTELDEKTYKEAIQAHDKGVSVEVSATVKRGSHGFEVLRVLEFEQIEPKTRAE